MKDVDVTLAFLDEDARTGGKSHSSKPKQTKPCFQWCNTSDFTVELETGRDFTLWICCSIQFKGEMSCRKTVCKLK
jgi:hypothetical protein